MAGNLTGIMAKADFYFCRSLFLAKRGVRVLQPPIKIIHIRSMACQIQTKNRIDKTTAVMY